MSDGGRPPCRLGICAMRKKARCEAMSLILRHVRESNPAVEVIIFEEESILRGRVEDWPVCDFLVAFHSGGFPLQRAAEYAQLRNPVLLCSLERQFDLLDRRKVLRILKENDIPYPETFISNDPKKDVIQNGDELIFAARDGIPQGRLTKPFIEKPAYAEDHHVWLYYPESSGGGIRKLFRKTERLSSEFCPGDWQVRSDGPYLYQPVYESIDRQDVKIYSIGDSFFHAECRKAPTVDGIVDRTAQGKERRVAIDLTEKETEMARRVTTAMNQFVCGFDLLRCEGQSFIIDVNGWSFVKGNDAYFRTCGRMLGSKLAELANHAVVKTNEDHGT